MNITPTRLEGVRIVESPVFRDDRGHFQEIWNAQRYADAGLDLRFVQDNLSFSTRGVLRGLHFQHPNGQGKLVHVVRGAVYDIAVDIRPDSPDFGRWVGLTLSDENRLQLFIPPGFAHGFAVLGDSALFSYKCTAPYSPADEGTVRWDDPDLAIPWPTADPVLNAKDRHAPRLREIEPTRLPRRASD